MFDQSFSSTEFKEIFDNENRKGNDLENKFKNEFIESLKLIPQLKASNLKIKQETDKNNLIVLLEERKEIKANRVAAINNILKIASTNIQAKINNLKLLQGPLNGTKPTYRIEPRLENVLMLKKLQYNVFKTYKVVQSSRHAILSQFINLISDTLPKYVVRVDLSSFYERIPQIQLRKKITEDHLLNVSSKKLITKILDEYNKLTSQIDINTAQGVPRGVGISSYLSELFMRDIDNKIKRMDDLVYYARYVDDMIIVFVPKTITVQKRELKNYETKTFNIIKESGMIVNDKKSESYNLVMKKDGLTEIHYRTQEFFDNQLIKSSLKRKPKVITYLGYQFSATKTVYKFSDPESNQKVNIDLAIDLSDKKLTKYKTKIRLSFDAFKNKKTSNYNRAFKLLYSRILYLTSNTQLKNNKSRVLVGVYYSNPFIHNSTSLLELDKFLKWHISRAGLIIRDKEKLIKLNFSNGFLEKKTCQFPIKKRKYKHHNSRKKDPINTLNNGIVQFGLMEINSIWKRS